MLSTYLKGDLSKRCTKSSFFKFLRNFYNFINHKKFQYGKSMFSHIEEILQLIKTNSQYIINQKWEKTRMYLLKEIEKYTKGKIINGNPETKSQEYCLTTDNYKKGEFFIPILFKNVNREEFIIDAVKAGAIGFFINKNSEDYTKIVEEAKKINPNIGIVEVEDVNQALYQLGLEVEGEIQRNQSQQ